MYCAAVRFGKYASLRSLRSRDRTVYISVNGKVLKMSYWSLFTSVKMDS